MNKSTIRMSYNFGDDTSDRESVRILQIKMLEQKLKRSDEKITTLKTQISILLKLNMDLKDKLNTSNCPNWKVELTPVDVNVKLQGNESASVRKDEQLDWNKLIKEKFNQMVTTRPKLKAKVLSTIRPPNHPKSRTNVKESHLKSKKTQKSGLKLRPIKELLKLKEPSPKSSHVQAVMDDLFSGNKDQQSSKPVMRDPVSSSDDPLEIRNKDKQSSNFLSSAKSVMPDPFSSNDDPPTKLELINEQLLGSSCSLTSIQPPESSNVSHSKTQIRSPNKMIPKRGFKRFKERTNAESKIESASDLEGEDGRFQVRSASSNLTRSKTQIVSTSKFEHVLFTPKVKHQVKRKYVPILPKLNPDSTSNNYCPKKLRTSVIQTILS